MTENQKNGDGKFQRTPMRERDPAVRSRNFLEVPYGYSEEEAVREAKRCIQCKKPLCVEGCPVNVKIPEFLKLISEGRFAEAAAKIKETNALPAICGRVCPQEDQCEKRCILGKKGAPICIGNLERFAADWERQHGKIRIGDKTSKWQRVAIVGSAGRVDLHGELVKRIDVTVLEALHEAACSPYGIRIQTS